MCSGHYVRTLGDIGNIECESHVILIEHDVCVREFAPAVYRCLPKVGLIIISNTSNNNNNNNNSNNNDKYQ
jgi:hypothetical protein